MTPRGTFHDRYAFAKDSPARFRQPDRLRLLDLLTCYATPECGPEYLEPAKADEFAVFDTATGEKAWFDAMALTPDQITGMVTSHFAAPARRVAGRLWVV